MHSTQGGKGSGSFSQLGTQLDICLPTLVVQGHASVGSMQGNRPPFVSADLARKALPQPSCGQSTTLSPGDDLRSNRVNVAHAQNLLALLVGIRLVDANCIDPERRFAFTPESTQRQVEVTSDL